MPKRIAASMALIAFALCLALGSLGAGNSFTTSILRAMGAMAATFFIGLLVGTMAQKMLEENLRAAEQKLKNPEVKPQAADR